MTKGKDIVRRFNLAVIEGGDRQAFEALMAADFVNHSAPPGMDPGAEGMWQTFDALLRPAISDLRVVIEDQVEEGDRVVTRKRIEGHLTGPLFGVAPTGAPISIAVMDIVRLEGGRYAEHWGMNDLAGVLAALRT